MRSLYARFVLWLIRPALERQGRITVRLTAEPLPTLDEISAMVSTESLRTEKNSSAGGFPRTLGSPEGRARSDY